MINMIPNIEGLETIVIEEGIMTAKMRKKDLVGGYFGTLIGIDNYVLIIFLDIQIQYEIMQVIIYPCLLAIMLLVVRNI